MESFKIHKLRIFCLTILIIFQSECLVSAGSNMGVLVTAIVETKKSSTSIRLQRATPKDLFLKFSKGIKGEITNIDLEGTQKSADLNEYFGLTFNYHDKMYYVIHREKGGSSNILGFYASGMNDLPIMVYSGLSANVQCLAMDWENDVLYWADPDNKVIMKTPVEPKCLAQDSATAIVSHLSLPVGVAVYPNKGYLFWTEGGIIPGIGRSDLEGKNIKHIVSRHVVNPGAITVDYENNRLYWIDNRGYFCIIESCNLDGDGRYTLKDVRESTLFDLDIFHNYIIATDTLKSRLYLIHIPTRQVVHQDWIGKPLGVKVFSEQRQQIFMEKMITNLTDHYFSMDRGIIFLGSEKGIYRMNRNYPDIASKEKISPFLPRNMTIAVTSDAHTKFLYFYENQLKTIQRIKLNIFSGVAENWTTSELVTLAVGKVEGLGVDWVARNLYWSDSALKQIMVAREDGQFIYSLVSENVYEPRSLVVHPTKRFVFWCDLDKDLPRIERCDLDGSRREAIVTGNKARKPRALAIDFRDDRLYWTDGTVIHYGKLNGTGQFCMHSSGSSTVRALIVCNDFIIWSDVVGRLHTAHKEYNKGQQHMFRSDDVSFVDLVYHDIASQPMTINPCSIRNGECDHICLPSSQIGYRCVCSLGYWNVNGKCISGVVDERFLIFADQRQGVIYQRPLFLDEYYAIPLQGIKQPRDVVYDSEKKLIYWTDIEQRTISKSMINGSNQDIIFYQFHMVPYTLALDAKSQLLYFVDISRDLGLIVVISLINLQYHTVINNKIKGIRDIALDPTRGMMYISCQHDMVFGNKTRSVGAIYSATMAGTNIKSFEIGLGKPKGIIVYEDDVIWVDAKRKSLEGKSITNGTKYTLKRIPELTELHDVAISDNYIYWTVLMGKAIKRSPLDNLTETENLGNANFYRVQGLEAYTGRTLYETNCSINRNVCRSICIPTPTGSQCTCTGGKFNNNRRTMRCEKYGRNRDYTKTKFCKTPFVANGGLVNIGSFRYVPVGYRLKIRCDLGYRIKWRKIPENNRYGYTLCLSRGKWNVRAACVWALPYTVQGDRNHGYVILHKSTQFLIPPRITLVEVICIGGGGGGFDSNIDEMKDKVRAGEGHESSFGDELIALGGGGGSLSAGGTGGVGTVYFGGDGGDANYCHYGGAAGQLTLPGTCYQPSTFCTFCGAGGRWPTCPLCSGRMVGGCTGPLSSSNGGPAGGLYGGGASGGSGGGGGGGGFSRGNVDVTPGELIPITVGRGGEPSYAPAGDGIVVISWGGRIEQFLEDRVSESLGKNLGC